MTVRARCKHFTTERQSDEKVTLKYECWIMNYVAGLCIMSVTVDRLSHLWLIEFSWWNSCWEALERLNALKQTLKRNLCCWESLDEGQRVWRESVCAESPLHEGQRVCFKPREMRRARACAEKHTRFASYAQVSFAFLTPYRVFLLLFTNL